MINLTCIFGVLTFIFWLILFRCFFLIQLVNNLHVFFHVNLLFLSLCFGSSGDERIQAVANPSEALAEQCKWTLERGNEPMRSDGLQSRPHWSSKQCSLVMEAAAQSGSFWGLSVCARRASRCDVIGRSEIEIIPSTHRLARIEII